MIVNSLELTQQLLAFTLAQDKNALLSLLKKYGVDVPNNPSDREITVAVLLASTKSPAFKADLAKVLSNEASKAKEVYSSFVGSDSDFGFTGIDDFSFTGIEEFENLFGSKKRKEQTGTVATPKPATPKLTAAQKRESRITDTNPQGKTGAGLFWQNLTRSFTDQQTLSNLLNTGLTALNNKAASKSNELAFQSNLITQQADEQRQLLSQSQKPKSSALVWVAVGVGVLALGGIIYFIAKRNK